MTTDYYEEEKRYKKEIAERLQSDPKLEPLRAVLVECGWPPATPELSPDERRRRLLTTGVAEFDEQFDLVVADPESGLLGTADNREAQLQKCWSTYAVSSLPSDIVKQFDNQAWFNLYFAKNREIHRKLNQFQDVGYESKKFNLVFDEFLVVRLLAAFVFRFLKSRQLDNKMLPHVHKVLAYYAENDVPQRVFSLCEVLSNALDELEWWRWSSVQLQRALCKALQKEETECRILNIEKTARRQAIEVVNGWMGQSSILNMFLQEWVDYMKDGQKLSLEYAQARFTHMENPFPNAAGSGHAYKQTLLLLLKVLGVENQCKPGRGPDINRRKLTAHIPTWSFMQGCESFLFKFIAREQAFDKEEAALLAYYITVSESFREKVFELPDSAGHLLISKLLPHLQDVEVNMGSEGAVFQEAPGSFDLKRELSSYLEQETVDFVPAIHAHQVYPASKEDLAGDSYIGGLPKLAGGLEWPVTSNGMPMHFLAQIKLSDLPQSMQVNGENYEIARHPEKGMLYFFAYCEDDELLGYNEEVPFKVVYSPEETINVVESVAPSDLPALTNFTVYQSHPRCGTIDRTYELTAFPKTPLRFETFMSTVKEEPVYQEGFAYSISPNSYFVEEDTFRVLQKLTWIEVYKKISARKHNSPSTYGYPSLAWPWMPVLQEADPIYKREVEVPDTYPWMWLVVERTALAIIGCINPANEVLRGAEDWIRAAREHDKFEMLDASTAQEFRDWLLKLCPQAREGSMAFKKNGNGWRLNPISSLTTWFRGLLSKFYRKPEKEEVALDREERERMRLAASSLSAALGVGFMASWPYIASTGKIYDIDKNFMEKLVTPHLPGNFADNKIHRLFGVIPEMQWINREVPEDHILLFQLSSDMGIDMEFGDCCVLQFWIKPYDLERAHFDDVILVTQN